MPAPASVKIKKLLFFLRFAFFILLTLCLNLLRFGNLRSCARHDFLNDFRSRTGNDHRILICNDHIRIIDRKIFDVNAMSDGKIRNINFNNPGI